MEQIQRLQQLSQTLLSGGFKTLIPLLLGTHIPPHTQDHKDQQHLSVDRFKVQLERDPPCVMPHYLNPYQQVQIHFKQMVCGGLNMLNRLAYTLGLGQEQKHRIIGQGMH